MVSALGLVLIGTREFEHRQATFPSLVVTGWPRLIKPSSIIDIHIIQLGSSDMSKSA